MGHRAGSQAQVGSIGRLHNAASRSWRECRPVRSQSAYVRGVIDVLDQLTEMPGGDAGALQALTRPKRFIEHVAKDGRQLAQALRNK
jgi:hypothetical protein